MPFPSLAGPALGSSLYLQPDGTVPPGAVQGGAMKQFIIIIRPFRVEPVMNALADLDLSACVVREAKGYSRQKGYLDRYAGSEYSLAFLPKVEISVWVKEDQAEEVVERITRAARMGRMGDGKVFVQDACWPEPLEF
jgi:nitrogen regulatory protein P-II 2